MLQPPETLKQFCYHRSYPCNNRVASGSHPCNKNVNPRYRARCPSPREPVRVVPIDAEIVPNCTKCKKKERKSRSTITAVRLIDKLYDKLQYFYFSILTTSTSKRFSSKVGE